VHPVDENNEEVLSRRTRIVEYKAHLSKQEEVKILAEANFLAVLPLPKRVHHNSFCLSLEEGGKHHQYFLAHK